MSIRFHCGVCNHKLKAGDELAGHRRQCPNCGEWVKVPGAPNPPPVVAPAGQPDSRSEDRPDLQIRLNVIGPGRWYRDLWRKNRAGFVVVHVLALIIATAWYFGRGDSAPPPRKLVIPAPVAPAADTAVATSKLRLGTSEGFEKACEMFQLWSTSTESAILRGRPLLKTSYKPDATRSDSLAVFADREGIVRAISCMLYGPYKLWLGDPGTTQADITRRKEWNDLATAWVKLFSGIDVDAQMRIARWEEDLDGTQKASQVTGFVRSRSMRYLDESINGCSLELTSIEVDDAGQYVPYVILVIIKDGTW